MRLLRFIRFVAITMIYGFISCSLLIFHGPFPNVKLFIVDSLTTSMHGYLLRPLSMYTLPVSYISAHAPQLRNTKVRTSPVMAHMNYQSVHNNSIQVKTYNGKTFSAKIMLIRDPKRLRVLVTKHLGNVGQSVSTMAKEYGAVAAINGGGFRDGHYKGTGGIPIGITIADGKVVQSDNSKQAPVIGFTQQGAMIAGAYSLPQLKKLHVDEALSFGPVLVQNGKGLMQGNGGWGYAPRAAIGQRKDGTIILIETDGRTPQHVGATLTDVQNLMLQYGATVAVNLDGGSSTTLVENGKLINHPSDILGERKVATAIAIMPEGWNSTSGSGSGSSSGTGSSSGNGTASGGGSSSGSGSSTGN
ncbi:phosphodiester glycosidase family protein [Alicyclobacillus sp. SO9]|uniref:phosphodiester glycosidase family protein n=1 Tax=Alicyclobacillus sp. SO9 TaxID=2665646 RepID=UPI0018E7B166|nr:phosphodiester glycosidase family protein [Alicyclobacillus sp. SO9]QQE77822.1 phosphodiester glycosidase family protein [Alicyclobacillus sp. SO9]